MMFNLSDVLTLEEKIMNRPLAVMILSYIIITPLLAEDKTNKNIELLGSLYYWSPATKVAISGDYAYLFAGGLRIIDISDPTKPIEVNHLPKFEIPYDFIVSDNLIFSHYYNPIDSRFNSLKIHDISDPVNPTEVGNMQINGNANQMVVVGNIAYIYYGTMLAIIDISDLNNLSVEVIYDERGVGDFDVSGHFIYMKTQYTGRISSFTILDATDPHNPITLSTTPLNMSVYTVKVFDNYAYMTTRSSGTLIYDITDPKKPVYINTLKPLNDNERVMSLSDNILTLYGMSDYYNRQLYMFDISDIMNPKMLDIPLVKAIGYHFSDNLLYLAAGSSGFQIYDFSDINQPELLGHLDRVVDVSNAKVFEKYAVIISDNSELRIIDISDLTDPHEVGSYNKISGIQDVSISGNYLLATSQYGGLHIVDISEPSTPFEVSSYGDDSATDISISGDSVFVRCLDGTRTIDISDPENLVEIGSSEISSMDQDSTSYKSKIKIQSIKDKLTYPLYTNPHYIKNNGPSNNLRVIEVRGDYAYVLADGLDIYDISNPIEPLKVGSIWFGETQLRSLYIVNDIAFVVCQGYGVGNQYVVMVNISDPENPKRIHPKISNKKMTVENLISKNKLVYICAGHGGLYIYDISFPINPLEVGYQSGNFEDITFRGDYLYSTKGHFGIYDCSRAVEIGKAR
jgi:hypothetical protein